MEDYKLGTCIQKAVVQPMYCVRLLHKTSYIGLAIFARLYQLAVVCSATSLVTSPQIVLNLLYIIMDCNYE